MPYPDAPWHLHGQLWLSLFRVRRSEHPGRRPGLYGAALVSYEEPSPLTYSELLVATPVRAKAHITDIWVDSPDSRDGGRALWAIPKDLAAFGHVESAGPVRRTTWKVSVAGTATVSASFSELPAPVPRLPFGFHTWQTRESGQEVVAPVSGRARVTPCRAHWDFHADGPLAWLAGTRPLASVRVRDFQMSFGG